MNGFYERLIDELKYQDISLATLAKGIDVADSTVRNFKKNVIPKADLAVKIADFLKVSVSWLITGEGSRTVMSPFDISDCEKEIIETFRILEDFDKEDVIDYLRMKKKRYARLTDGNVTKYVRDC